MDPIEDKIIWRERTNRIGDIFDKENERVTMKEINEEFQKEKDAFFDKR
jgi:hypothetical protein